MQRLGFVAALVVGSVLLLAGGAAAGGARPVAEPMRERLAAGKIAEPLREQQAVARIAARGLPLYCGGGRKREIALTFDDGPTGFTPRLLAVLRRAAWSPSQAAAPATFFVIGQSAANYPSYARAEAELGAVGTHTQHHRTLTRLRLAAARREIAEGKTSLERVLRTRVLLFRPPGGHRNPAIDRIVASEGLLAVGWAVDPRDWAHASPSSVVAALASDPRIAPGAIVVLHEFRLSTIDAVPEIVRLLRHRGLRPVTVPRLLADDPPTLAEQRADANAGGCVHLYGHAD